MLRSLARPAQSSGQRTGRRLEDGVERRQAGFLLRPVLERLRVERADLVRAELVEPRPALRVEHDAVRARARRRHLHEAHGAGLRALGPQVRVAERRIEVEEGGGAERRAPAQGDAPRPGQVVAVAEIVGSLGAEVRVVLEADGH